MCFTFLYRLDLYLYNEIKRMTIHIWIFSQWISYYPPTSSQAMTYCLYFIVVSMSLQFTYNHRVLDAMTPSGLWGYKGRVSVSNNVLQFASIMTPSGKF